MDWQVGWVPECDNDYPLSWDYINVLRKGKGKAPYTPLENVHEDICWRGSSIKVQCDLRGAIISRFLSLDPELQAIANSQTSIFGNADSDKIQWWIFSQSQQITECPMEVTSENTIHHMMLLWVPCCSLLEALMAVCWRLWWWWYYYICQWWLWFVNESFIPWHSNTIKVNYNSILLENFFPCTKGLAKILDKFLHWNPKDPKVPNPWKDPVERDNIVLSRECFSDPDALVKYFISFLIYFIL